MNNLIKNKLVGTWGIPVAFGDVTFPKPSKEFLEGLNEYEDKGDLVDTAGATALN